MKTKLLFIGHRNSQDIIKEEILYLLNKFSIQNTKITLLNSSVLLELESFNEKDIINLFFYSRTILHIFLIFGESFDDLFSIKNYFNNQQFKTFDFKIYDLTYPEKNKEYKQNKVNTQTNSITQIKNKLNLIPSFSIPDLLFSEIKFKNKSFFGINLSGREMSKRDYKIYKTQESIKGTIASLALFFSDFQNNKESLLLDLFCNEGVIPIEATLLKKQESPFKFVYDKFLINKIDLFRKKINKIIKERPQSFFKTKDKSKNKKIKTIFCVDPSFKSIDFAKKNASIANVLDELEISRTDIGWLDIKFENKTFDFIISKLPKNLDIKKLNLLFERANQITNKNSTMTLISKNKETNFDEIDLKKFKLEDQIMIFSGNEKYVFYKFLKN